MARNGKLNADSFNRLRFFLVLAAKAIIVFCTFTRLEILIGENRMRTVEISQQWIEKYEAIRKNTLGILIELQFEKENDNGHTRTSVVSTLQQQLKINDNAKQHENLVNDILSFLNIYPLQKSRYTTLEEDYESYLYFHRVGRDIDENTWKKIFIREFNYITDNIIGFICELAETIHNSNEYKCFRTAESCNLTINYDKKKIFVIMPFDKMFDDLYQIGIKETMLSLGYKCSRADEIFHTHDIMCRGICKPIQEAFCIIADMTNKNANVFFELGLAYGFEKDVLLIANSIEDIPFDLRGMQSIIYDGQIVKLRENLIKIFK